MPLTTKILNHILHQEGDFNSLAVAVFLHQYQHCSAYQAYCHNINKTPENVFTWQDIPAVSTEVFREFDLTSADPRKALYVFQTSGTTQEIKGKHYYHDMSLYNAAIQASFMQGLRLSHEDRPIFRILTPSFADVPTSSLFYMFQKALEWYGHPASRFYFKHLDIDNTQLAHDLAEDIVQNHPIVLLGTAFSFVNFCDYLSEHKIHLKLPQGSKLLETGGLKGRSRSVSREELYSLFTTQLGLDQEHCFSEYGMTELSSQCYSQASSPILTSPHWMQVRIIDPETNKEVTVGETGLVQFFDLANYSAVSALLTSDLAIKHQHGFELMGRAPKAVLRGCSTAFEK